MALTLQEIISAFLFMFIVSTIYLKEAHLILKAIVYKIIGREAKTLLLSKRAIILHILSLVGILCFVYSYFIEPYWLQVNVVDIYTDKLKSTSLTIAQISDLHCDLKVRNENKLPGIINSFKPDIIVFTGDAINDSRALPLFKKTLSSLNASIGKFAVRGNFDVFIWWNLNLFNNTGFKVLRQDSVRLSKGADIFYIAGLSRLHPENYPLALANIPASAYSIFLYHTPALIEHVSAKAIDLYLTGHTHGGQVALPFYGALVTLSKHGKKYESGLYRVGHTILYVNRGIGMEGGIAPRVRFLARPEITVFRIHPLAQKRKK
ncbi:MAG: metallophosphoesterase [Candidatus Omnitrophica bacterium]|nr:metallophosphoesterase [Candidatus Omnitrophota bacterium]